MVVLAVLYLLVINSKWKRSEQVAVNGNQASPRISPSSSPRIVNWLVNTAISWERTRKRECPGKGLYTQGTEAAQCVKAHAVL